MLCHSLSDKAVLYDYQSLMHWSDIMIFTYLYDAAKWSAVAFSDLFGRFVLAPCLIKNFAANSSPFLIHLCRRQYPCSSTLFMSQPWLTKVLAMLSWCCVKAISSGSCPVEESNSFSFSGSLKNKENFFLHQQQITRVTGLQIIILRVVFSLPITCELNSIRNKNKISSLRCFMARWRGCVDLDLNISYNNGALMFLKSSVFKSCYKCKKNSMWHDFYHLHYFWYNILFYHKSIHMK